MNTPQRGDIWLVDFGSPVGHEQAGRRPAVVVSTDRLNDSAAGVVIVVPCTTTKRDLPSHIEIDGPEAGLTEPSYAKGEDLKSVSEDRLVARLGQAPAPAMFDLAKVLRFLLDL